MSWRGRGRLRLVGFSPRRPRGPGVGVEGEVRKKQSSNKQVRKNKFGDRGLGIPRCSISPEILGLLGPTRHRKSMISLRKIEVFGYGAPASGSEAALGALTCSGCPCGVVPGVISGSPGAPFGVLGSDFRALGVLWLFSFCSALFERRLG